MLYKFEIRIESSAEAIVEASSEAEARQKAEEHVNWLNGETDDTWERVDVQDLIEKGHKLEDCSRVFEDKKVGKSTSNV